MSESTSLAGRTAIVTGAGAGLGRSEALALAANGARVVVNDIGPTAEEVVAEIRSAGGEAVAVVGDVGDWSIGDRLVGAALDSFGSLDIVVNNAGVVRDKMLFNLTESDWDEVVRIHLKGHAAMSRAAGAYWRRASKAAGAPVYARIINTSSEAGLLGAVAQPNYSAAKAGITALTLSTARSLSRYGVRANVICPRARTGMTAQIFGAHQPESAGPDILSPERVATFVAYLAAPAAQEINGQVFVVYGDMVALLSAPTVERKFTAGGEAFTVDELAGQLTGYFSGRDPRRTFAAHAVAELDTAVVASAATGQPG
ncbi:3-oxoacyl-ACP reductase [Micromonospora sp. NPDC050200]|uniref:3-oxoacyl-ACP reductase n=1 Tax=Micromonospora sp. NPDC050200 TaxID=3155664 RepID=UPI0033EC1280